ncbi:2-methylcitrate dehydratase [Aneurinibacillus migulanus]|uniref:2-methylcitrate dehydratase n=1 Tax=Aneurinibacillus migulanus TaxID=47500 RepID=A0A0D1YFL8_ANEMI|nr:2-methylcitrate dehydratase [Aneurinibacillus migulanus]KON98472.1 2-methylcitrate dehydratase [Aneurinibacillus migulanus]
MFHLHYNGEVKKVVNKQSGEKEITLVVPREQLRGKLDSLDDILGGKAAITFDSLVVNYNIEINTQTNEPLKKYQVDDKGVVHEVKPEGEQLETDFGLPKAKIPTKEEREKVEREIVGEFILSGLAPSYEDLPYDFTDIVKRRLEGETYMKLASELGISSGKIVELIDEYRKRVVPLAMKWDEWRQGKEQPKQEAKEEPKAEMEDKPEGNESEDKGEDEEEQQDGVA